MKTCPHCKTQFEIRVEDQKFYQKISVPAPTLCHACREHRRLAFRNEIMLYSRPCGLCKKQMVSAYAPDSQYIVYCRECWRSDKWDPMSYAKDFDFTRPFFEQLAELKRKVPREALSVMGCETSPYINECGWMEKSYMCNSSGYSKECFYTMYGASNFNCADLLKCQKNELCYESVETFGSFNSAWLLRCDQMIESFFCFDCKNSSRCIMCSNLKNKNLHIFNKLATEKEYNDFKARMGNAAELEKIKTQWKEMIGGAIHKFGNIVNCQNATGDALRNAVNCKDVYDCEEINNVNYCFNIFKSTDTLDVCSHGDQMEFCYECQGCGTNVSKLLFCSQTGTGSSGNDYCDYCSTTTDCFGCIGLTKKSNCILNKKYSKEEYAALRNRIIQHMRPAALGGTGEWGEFFPGSLSPFGYNETVAQLYYPLTKEQAQALGYNWKENLPGTYGKETTHWPEAEKSPDITKEILACTNCKKNYKIIAQELAFYKKMGAGLGDGGLALPRQCPECRLKARLALRNPRKLWRRECSECKTSIDTTFAPDRPEKVLCQECYLKEAY